MESATEQGRDTRRHPQLAEALRRARRATGKNQAAFAEAIGAPLNTYGNWERGDQAPRHRGQAIIMEALGIDEREYDDLVRGTATIHHLFPGAQPDPSVDEQAEVRRMVRESFAAGHSTDPTWDVVVGKLCALHDMQWG